MININFKHRLRISFGADVIEQHILINIMNNHQKTSIQHNASTLYSVDNSNPKYFDISILRLIVMDIITLGLYTMYWFYRNLKALQLPGQSNILLLLKAIFNMFFAYPLFTSMANSIIRTYPEKKHCLKQAQVYGWIYGSFSITSFFLVGLVQASYFVNVGMYVGRMLILCLIQRDVLWHHAKVTPNYKPIQNFTMAEVFLMFVWPLFLGMLLLILVCFTLSHASRHGGC